MRNLLILSALLAPLATASRSAPACGFYMPKVFLVEDHYIPDGGAHHERSFVMADHRDVPTEGWTALAPRSYDATQIADAPAIQPMTLTLLGNGAAQTVTTTKRVFVRDSFGDAPAMGAYEIDTGGKHFSIAVSGSHVDLAFAALAQGVWSQDDAKWLADNNLAWRDASIETLGNLDALTAYVDGQFKTTIRRDGHLVGTYDGRPLGRLDSDGMQYLLVEHAGDVRSIYI